MFDLCCSGTELLQTMFWSYFCKLFSLGLLRRLGYLEMKQPNMSAESFYQTLFWDAELKEKMKLNEIGIIDTGWVNSQFSSSWYVNCHQLYSYEFLAK